MEMGHSLILLENPGDGHFYRDQLMFIVLLSIDPGFEAGGGLLYHHTVQQPIAYIVE